MKPLTSRTEDIGTLQDLGRASIQIVHDLKNQLNGLKLYATFLRKRLEKGERPEDEQETVTKLITGLDRAANDLSTIVQYGREIELKKQSGIELQKVMRGVCSSLSETGDAFTCIFEPESIQGSFDQTKLADALKWISVVALKHTMNGDQPRPVLVSVETADSAANIEWSNLSELEYDPFKSFSGTDEIRMSLAGRIIEAHGGSARCEENKFIVMLPLSVE